MPQLTPQQIKQLQQLGLNPDLKQSSLTEKPKTKLLNSHNNTNSQFQQNLTLTGLSNPNSNNSNNLNSNLDNKKSFPIFPLLSISGLTILSFSGLLLLKSKNTSDPNIQNNNTSPLQNNQLSPSPTQVPKSIQHYLLASQQYFTQALQQQDGQSNQNQVVDLLNQSILSATEAIKEFPDDYRAFLQRGRIYQSLLQSQPQLSDQALSDLNQAQKLNPNSAEITRNLASLYAFKGDAQNTITYLQQTIILEPTKAQNFYDLAKIQQQSGLLSQAIDTYDQLISIVSDPQQQQQIKSEKSSLENLLSQNPDYQNSNNIKPQISPLPLNLDSPTIQALADNNITIAAPEEINKVEVSNLTDSNALSGSSILPANQQQITINNSNLTPNSQVYLSITKGGKNQNLQVLSKTDSSFTIGLSQPISENIEFNWWIIE